MREVSFLLLWLLSVGPVRGGADWVRWPPNLTLNPHAQLAIRAQQRSQPDSAAMFWQLAAQDSARQSRFSMYCRSQRVVALAEGRKARQALAAADSLIHETAGAEGLNRLVRADAHEARGLVYLGESQYHRAIDQQQQALALRQATLGDSHPLIATSYVRIGTVYYYIDKDSLAQTYYQRALTLQRATLGDSACAAAITRIHLCEAHYFLNDYAQATLYGEQAMAGLRRSIGTDNATYARCLFALGNAYGWRGHVKRAITLHRLALDIYRRTCGEQHRLTALAYQQVGWAYDMHGEYDRALDYGQQALERMQALYGEDNVQLTSVHHILGGTYAKLNQHAQALAHYQKNLALSEQQLADNPAATMLPYQNLGRLSYNQNRCAEANAYYHKSLNIQRQFRGEKHVYTVSLYTDMAANHAKANLLDSALIYHRMALQTAQLIYGEKHADIARSYYEIAQLMARKKDVATALVYVQQTLSANLPAYTAGAITQNPTGVASADPYSRSQLWNALQLKSSLLYQRYRTDHDTTWLTASWATYRVLDSLMTRNWQVGDNEAERPELARVAATIYGEALPVCLALSPAQGGGPAQAFRLAQQSKAMLLRATLDELAAQQTVDLPDSLRQTEHRLRTAINQYEQQLATLTTTPMTDTTGTTLRAARFLANRQLEELTLRLERDYPHFRQQKYQTQPVTVAQLQQRLPPRTALIDYMLTDSLLVTFTLTRTRFDTRTQPISALFRRRLLAFRTSIQEREPSVYNPVAYQLYRQLLPTPLPDSIESLLIVAAGELAQIPFEALLTKPTPQSVSDGHKPYLLRRYAVAYTCSATLWYQNNTASPTSYNVPAAQPSGRLLAVAPVFTAAAPATAGASAFSSLPATEQEVQTLGQLITDAGGQATLLTRQRATETLFKKADLASYQYIHIATHGLLNARPELSGLVMAPDSSSTDDGILYSGELYSLPIRADLVVFSACDTGLGTLVPGEGIVGLGRALFYAGARNLSVSLWAVPDASTATLMTRFYGQLLAGKAQPDALRTAKLALLSTPRHAAPYYWASFILLSSGSPSATKRTN